ncbi:SMP-30/gluconolactonase/LRE family protein [Paraburkholderia sp.]|uniref:SMP-30/gluconolactonase/LRE family protein n=1 Tax=Paraburkholderia sp. TaxID=1926495 RepID=UPI0039E6DC43
MTKARVTIDSLARVGSGLVRPECVLTNWRGDVFTADWRGGVAHRKPDGTAELYLAESGSGPRLRPNGIALCRDGSFLVADLGEHDGGLYRLTRTGQVTRLLDEVDGVCLPPSNFPLLDVQGRIWLTVSTRRQPRAEAYRRDVADGFVVLLDQGCARIVADGLGYTNEAQISPDGQWLYVNETFGRRLSRFRIGGNGDLGPRETVTVFGEGVFPDGLCFDAEGGIWITSIVSNRVIRIAPSGEQQLIIEDCDEAHLAWVEAAYLNNSMSREHLDRSGGAYLGNISSLAFGGSDLKTAYLGCLLDDCVYRFRSPVAGLASVHWLY